MQRPSETCPNPPQQTPISSIGFSDERSSLGVSHSRPSTPGRLFFCSGPAQRQDGRCHGEGHPPGHARGRRSAGACPPAYGLHGDNFSRGEGRSVLLGPPPQRLPPLRASIPWRHGRIIDEVVLPDGFTWWCRRYAPEDEPLAELVAEARIPKRDGRKRSNRLPSPLLLTTSTPPRPG